MERKPSRPKFIAENTEKIIMFARHGLSESEIADLLGISRSYYREYLTKHEDLSHNIRNEKALADITVEEALFKRATGYETIEEHFVYLPVGESESSFKLKERKLVRKFVPPDAANALIWLFNRKGTKWSKNPDANSELSNNELTTLRRLAAEEAAENM